MASLNSLVQQSLTPGTIQKISRQLGADEQAVKQGINVALPLLVSALNRNAGSASGADALTRALQRDHDGTALKRVGTRIAKGETADGRKILGHILGDQQAPIEQVASRGTGIDMAKLLELLAPLVLAAITKQLQDGKMTPTDVAGSLSRERRRYEQRNGGLMSVIGQMLDRNQDGSAFDDLAVLLGDMMQQRAQAPGTRG